MIEYPCTVYLKTENSIEPAPQLLTSLVNSVGSQGDLSNFTSTYQSPFSLTFDFSISRSEFANSNMSSRIMILNVPDYSWFRKDGAWKTTTASAPFFFIDDVNQSQSAYLVGVVGEEIYRHTTALRFLRYFQRWDLIMARISEYDARTRRNGEVPTDSSPPSSSSPSINRPSSPSIDGPSKNVLDKFINSHSSEQPGLFVGKLQFSIRASNIIILQFTDGPRNYPIKGSQCKRPASFTNPYFPTTWTNDFQIRRHSRQRG
jgi:hypothetical protein